MTYFPLHTSVWNRRNRILLLENIEMYISAGLNLNTALDTVGPTFREKQRASLGRVCVRIEQGHSLSRSFADEHIGFSTAIVGLIEQGEQSGNLPQSLKLARTIIEREDALIKTCMSALAYPIIIGLFALILTLGLMRGVMPQIIPLLKSLHVTLPLITRIVIAVSENLMTYGLYLCGGVMLFIPLCMLSYKKWHFIRSCCHHTLIHIPVLGSLFCHYSLSIMIRSLGSLIVSGVSSTDAYIRTTERLIFIPLKVHFDAYSRSLSEGVTLSSAFTRIRHIPSYIAPLVGAGEASGTLGASLMRSSDILDRDIEHSLKRLTALVEPVMMAGMGCGIGAIALSIMMPIYDVSKALQH